MKNYPFVSCAFFLPRSRMTQLGVVLSALLLPTMVAAAPLLTVQKAHPVVAIDAGHGGKHDGAQGVCGVKEKTITLAIAEQVFTILDAGNRVTPIMTRSDDSFVGLGERAQIAENAGAQIFLSVHSNSSTNAKHSGVEIYFLSNKASDKRTKKLIKRESDGESLKNLQPQTTLKHILSGLSEQVAHHESQRLAIAIADTLEQGLHLGGRGVLQAPFIVLKDADMAAVLVETGFLTNKKECERLTSKKGQRDVARLISKGILHHLQNSEYGRIITAQR